MSETFKHGDYFLQNTFDDLKGVNRYAGTKIIDAAPMTRGDYNVARGWQIPEDENPHDLGYVVRYSDGYISWSPADTFDASYRNTEHLPFGVAIELCRRGARIARKGWNGKNMFVVYQKGYPQGIPCNKQTAEAFGMTEGEMFCCEPYLQMRNAQGSHNMWLASQSDILADDWIIVE